MMENGIFFGKGEKYLEIKKTPRRGSFGKGSIFCRDDQQFAGAARKLLGDSTIDFFCCFFQYGEGEIVTCDRKGNFYPSTPPCFDNVKKEGVELIFFQNLATDTLDLVQNFTIRCKKE